MEIHEQIYILSFYHFIILSFVLLPFNLFRQIFLLTNKLNKHHCHIYDSGVFEYSSKM